MNGRKTPKDMDEYIAGYPRDVQKLLQQVRRTIKRAAPGAVEAIKYQIPTFTLSGNLISFAAYKNHIGIYPAPRSVPEFAAELSAYAGEKSTLRLPLDQPIPVDLITRIVKFRVKNQLKRAGEMGLRTVSY